MLAIRSLCTVTSGWLAGCAVCLREGLPGRGAPPHKDPRSWLSFSLR